MFGTYRFILSLLVVAEHSGINRNKHFDLISPNYHIGASAVVAFYVLSGYVMAHSIFRNFNLDIKRTLSFYEFKRFSILERIKYATVKRKIVHVI